MCPRCRGVGCNACRGARAGWLFVDPAAAARERLAYTEAERCVRELAGIPDDQPVPENAVISAQRVLAWARDQRTHGVSAPVQTHTEEAKIRMGLIDLGNRTLTGSLDLVGIALAPDLGEKPCK